MKTGAVVYVVVVVIIGGIFAAMSVGQTNSSPRIQTMPSHATNSTWRVIGRNLTVYYGTACMILETFRFSCPTLDTIRHSPSLGNVDLISYRGNVLYGLNFTGYWNGQADFRTLWFTNTTIFCVSPNVESYNPCPTQPYRFVLRVASPSAADFNASNGLQLTLRLSTNSTVALGVELDVYNTLDKVNNVTVENNWPIPQIDLKDICPGGIGYVVYKGNYVLSNFTRGAPLALTDPYSGLLCASPPSSYLFRPHSSVADVYLKGNLSSALKYNITMSVSANLAGYWASDFSGPSQRPVFNVFPQGTYTIVALDGWGQVVLLRFDVENS